MFTIPDDDLDEELAELDTSVPELFRSAAAASQAPVPTLSTSSSRHYVPGVTTGPPAPQPLAACATPANITPAPRLPATKLPKRLLPPNFPLRTKPAAPLDHGTASSVRELLVHPRQSGNPVLKYIENCKQRICDQIVPDFVFSPTRCATFISLRYQSEHPGYLESRFRNIPLCLTLRVVLCFVDRVRSSLPTASRSHPAQPDSATPLQHISKLCIRNRATLLCVWR